MLEKWYNFKDTRPNIYDTSNGYKESDQIMVLVDGKLYIGVYLEEEIWNDDEKVSYKSESLELGGYSLTHLDEKYSLCGGEYGDNVLYDGLFYDHEIYWSPIDMINLLLNVDLTKKEEEVKKYAIKTESDVNRQGDQDV